MATVVAYERPGTLEEALELLGRPATSVLAGGTRLNAAASREPLVVVDLQALPLDRIEQLGDGALAIGATATLQQLADHPDVPAAVRDAARHELPSTLRAAATVGGCVATRDWDSSLLALLLAHEAHVRLVAPGLDDVVHLDGVLDSGPQGRLITEVTIATTGRSVLERTGRTPADRAIVAAAARRTGAGEVVLALAGVAARPVLVDSVETLDELEPPADFRGSTDYRRALAVTLARRALEAVS